MDVRGSKLGQDGVRILNTLRGIRPVTDIDGRVEYQVGRTALKAGQAVLTFEIFPAALRVGVKLVVFSAHNRLQSLSRFLCGGGSRSLSQLGTSASTTDTCSRFQFVETSDQLLLFSLEVSQFLQELLLLTEILLRLRLPGLRGSPGVSAP